MMDTVFDGEIAPEFESGSKALIPIIFCHGISSNRTMQSGTCRDFASHGYIVFMLDHRDGTASFYERAKEELMNPEFGSPGGSYYDNSKVLYDFEHRRDQIQIRVKEVISLIDEIY
jgi:dienelactone hydrolase